MIPIPVVMHVDASLGESSFAPIQQLDNPAVVEIVQLTGNRMACVSKFWREAVARAQYGRLYELSRVQEIRDRFPVLASLSMKSLPYEVFNVSKRIHEEVVSLLERLPENKKTYYQSLSPITIMNSQHLFLQLVHDVPPLEPFYKRIFCTALHSIRHKIEAMDLFVLDEDGRLPSPC